jgi:N-acetyl-gamma-glutamyl-phosphate reductase
MEQILGLPDRIVFVPHLAPFNRGLLSTVSMQIAQAKDDFSAETAQALYEEFYAKSAFVSVLPAGEMPQTASVAGTNNAQIGIAYHASSRTLIAVSAIDNLCKGAAGQAIQCANIVFGFPETAGLSSMALPV